MHVVEHKLRHIKIIQSTVESWNMSHSMCISPLRPSKEREKEREKRLQTAKCLSNGSEHLPIFTCKRKTALRSHTVYTPWSVSSKSAFCLLVFSLTWAKFQRALQQQFKSISSQQYERKMQSISSQFQVSNFSQFQVSNSSLELLKFISRFHFFFVRLFEKVLRVP